MVIARVLLCLSLAALSSASVAVSTSEIADKSSMQPLGALYAERRRRRGTTPLYVKPEFEWAIQKNKTWCFCGRESLVEKFKRAYSLENIICALEAKANFTSGPDDDFSTRVSTQLKRNQCIYDCMFTQISLLTPGGKLNYTAVVNVFRNSVFVEEELKEISEKVMDRCLTNGTEIKRAFNIALSAASGITCSKAPFKFISCLLIEMTLDCPESLKRPDDVHCKTLYDNIQAARELERNFGRNLRRLKH